jgi:hypothetical protein
MEKKQELSKNVAKKTEYSKRNGQVHAYGK